MNPPINIPKTLETAVNAHQMGNLARAEELYRAILGTDPRQFDALHLLGVSYAQRGNFAEAVRLIEQALAIRPRDHLALFNSGRAFLSLGRPDEALRRIDRALSIRPDYAEAYNTRGNAMQDLGRPEEALESYDRALAIRPDLAEAHNNRANILLGFNRFEEALESYDRALALHPGYAEALNNRGNALLNLNRFDEALESYDRALALRPNYAEAHNNRGNVLVNLRRMDEALESFDRALAINPRSAKALFNRGRLLQELKRLDEAISDFQRVIEIDPNYRHSPGTLYTAKRHACDWRNYDKETASILAESRAGTLCATPWQFLAASDSPDDQLRYVRAWQREMVPASEVPLWQGERYRHDRIRIAYVSADFHDHPLAWLMSGLFEQHDRSKFETIAVSFGPDKPGPARTRLEGAFERFIDVRQKSSREIAGMLREMEVDIAIDRKGYTRDQRTEIFARRPAPIQVNYLAYPGTMGADYIDYIIADRFVIPEANQRYFSENVVYLPDSYQPNDSRRPIADVTLSRADVGLPDNGFVFACFNNIYKITPQMFDIWMRLLKEVEGSVLWLLDSNPAAARNLRRETEERGVAPERLVFAPFMDNASHLARLRLADLFLDTLPFNAHTTASDALWAGLPVVTCLGTTFAGRVGGGLLSAIGLPDLITESLEDYETKILELVRDDEALSEIRSRLAQNRKSQPLFDTARYTRNLERAFEEMWTRYQHGDRPAGFSVSAL